MDLVLSFQKQSKEGKMESCSTLPTVIILTSVGWEVKRITLPPTDRPSKNSDKNTPLYFFFFFLRRVWNWQSWRWNVLKFWRCGLVFLPSIAREELGCDQVWLLRWQILPWAPIFKESSSIYVCVYIYIHIYIYTLRNREHGICLGRIYSLVKDISKMKQCQPNRYIIKSCLTW